jgi:hypothetical protein
MKKRRVETLRSLVGTGLQVAAVISLVRRIGPKRIGRMAALATEGYLAHVRPRRRYLGR